MSEEQLNDLLNKQATSIAQNASAPVPTPTIETPAENLTAIPEATLTPTVVPADSPTPAPTSLPEPTSEPTFTPEPTPTPKPLFLYGNTYGAYLIDDFSFESVGRNGDKAILEISFTIQNKNDLREPGSASVYIGIGGEGPQLVHTFVGIPFGGSASHSYTVEVTPYESLDADVVIRDDELDIDFIDYPFGVIADIPTPTPAPTWTPTPAPTPTPSPTPAPTHTPGPTPTPTLTPLPTSTPPPPTPTAADRDRETLIAIYNATGGYWQFERNWLTSAPLSEWFGVKVDDAGRVVRLDLNNRDMLSEIPPQFGELDELRHLNLEFNGLLGEIPPELGNLKNLKYLSLRGNELSGSLPPELGKLTNLVYLDLEWNSFSGRIPTELGELPHLNTFIIDDIGSTKLSGCIPAGLKSVPVNDLDKLGLPFCAGPTMTPTITPTPDPNVTPTVTPVPTSTPMAAPPSQAESDLLSELSEKEYELVRHIHSQVNGARGRYKSELLAWDMDIFVVAQAHARDMADNEYLSHINLEGKSPFDREEDAGLNCYRETEHTIVHNMGENLSWYENADLSRASGRLAQTIVENWLDSSDHRENMLHRVYIKTGIGVAITGNHIYVTQNFC